MKTISKRAFEIKVGDKILPYNMGKDKILTVSGVENEDGEIYIIFENNSDFGCWFEYDDILQVVIS